MSITGHAVLAQHQVGAIRASIEAHGTGLTLFAQKDQNEIIRNALERGGWYWIYVDLPKRFTDYAFELGYNQRSKTYANWKQKVVGHQIPLVFTGQLRSVATKGARARATASKGSGTIFITIPTPAVTDRKGRHINYANVPKTQVGIILRTIPPKEIKAIAQAVESALIEGLEEAMTARIDPQSSSAVVQAERREQDKQAKAIRAQPAAQRRKV